MANCKYQPLNWITWIYVFTEFGWEV